jgi:restriction system protein
MSWRTKRKRRNTTAKGTRYEKHVAAKMRWRGYLFVRRVGQSGDFGADCIGYTWLLRKVIVQCKNYRGKVGVSAVQEAYAAKAFYHAKRAAVATNSTFTDSARQLAKVTGVELWERY